MAFKAGDRVRLAKEIISRRWSVGATGTVKSQGSFTTKVVMDTDTTKTGYNGSRDLSLGPGQFELIEDQKAMITEDGRIWVTGTRGAVLRDPQEFRVGDRVRKRSEVARGYEKIVAPRNAVGKILSLDVETPIANVEWGDFEYPGVAYKILLGELELVSPRVQFRTGDRIVRINDTGEGYKTTPYARKGDTGVVVREDTTTARDSEPQYIIAWDDPKYRWTQNYVVAAYEIQLVSPAPPAVPKVPSVEEKIGRLRHGGFLR